MAKGKKRSKKRDEDDSGESSLSLGISQETRNSIAGIFCFLVVIVSILAFVGKAGSAGVYFDLAARSLFGWGFFIVPVAFAMLGVAFIKSIHRKVALSAMFGTLLFVLAVLGVFYSVGEGDAAQRIVQGGYLGVALGWPLLSFIGFWAALVVLVGLVVVAVLLTLDVPIYQLFMRSSEAEDDAKELEMKEKDIEKLVVKSGGRPIEEKPLALPATAPMKPKEEPKQSEFVIRAMKAGNWRVPPTEFLSSDQDHASSGDINASAAIIKRTLANFGIEVEMGEVSVGPTVTQYTMRPAVGVKLSRITTLASDLSLALAAHPIRIEAPIPGKSLVGIEVPNKKVSLVGMRSMLESDDYRKSKFMLPLALGRDVSGEAVFAGLDKMPHILIAGQTGSGKSVTIHGIILSMLYRYGPELLRFIMVDPKRVELPLYDGIPHLLKPVITENKKVPPVLKQLVMEMDQRYAHLSEAKVRDVVSYNEWAAKKDKPIMPYIVVVIDEMADLMKTFGKEVEPAIVRLAQMARAVGIHLILATQRPEVSVLTGLIKANINARVALRVANQLNSRIIIDTSGAETLLGNGDMLFIGSDTAQPRRLQGPFVATHEIEEVVKFIKTQAEELGMESETDSLAEAFEAPAAGAAAHGLNGGSDDDIEDERYEEAKALVIELQKASASLLQRRMGLGYARAARMLDILESKGVIGPGDGAKPRQVFITRDGAVVGGPVLNVESGMHADTPEAERAE
ncbi:MAG: DNA translocase FtsK 4TM domain-containing protein [Candidatus Yanofskybacteria bacterium]|nr:DNA translocase FtsK 4TM domain-containing protein [Candidatus Yanofskybacteria bacterium]